MAPPASYFGLTGGVACGKTTAARMFEEFGVKIIDADRLGHELVRAPRPAYQEIVHHFGFEILDSSGEIDRKRLGAVVFADPRKLQQLNSILHPRIIGRAEELALAYHATQPDAVVLVDAALIFEAGIEKRFVKVVVAWCRPEQQLERLMAKSGLSRGEAERRIAAQMPVEDKRHRADFVIDCSASLEGTREQVRALYLKLRQLVRERQSKLET